MRGRGGSAERRIHRPRLFCRRRFTDRRYAGNASSFVLNSLSSRVLDLFA